MLSFHCCECLFTMPSFHCWSMYGSTRFYCIIIAINSITTSLNNQQFWLSYDFKKLMFVSNNMSLRWIDTLSGEKLLPFSFLPPFTKKSLLLKERICSSRSKFFPLKIDSFLERFHFHAMQTGSHKLSSIVKLSKKYCGVPTHLCLLVKC